MEEATPFQLGRDGPCWSHVGGVWLAHMGIGVGYSSCHGTLRVQKTLNVEDASFSRHRHPVRQDIEGPRKTFFIPQTEGDVRGG